MPNVLVVSTGSVAAVRTGLLAEQLRAQGHDVRVVHTASAAAFLRAERPLPAWLPLFSDAGEWRLWKELGDPVQHIDLRNWASVLVFAPLDANTLAKLAAGICDNLATCIARAWPVGESPFVVAPAMNTAMWNHPVTDGQIRTLRGWGVTFVGPVVKKLACGDTGIGAMATPEEIVLVVEEALQSSNAAKNSTSSAAVVE